MRNRGVVMQIDLHIHTKYSDGELDIPPNISALFSEYNLIAITDHEHIFDPTKYQICDSARFISGVEICCNYEGQNIEILGYDFDAKNSDIIRLVDRVKNLRINAIRKILDENKIYVENLPPNPFRINVSLPDGVNAHEFWQLHKSEYINICHSLPAADVIRTIVAAQGIPVFAHPMETLATKSENEVEKFILSLGIHTVELITPKHANQDVRLIRNIIIRNNLSGSIGSDSHKTMLTKIPHQYDISEKQFKWIRELVGK